MSPALTALLGAAYAARLMGRGNWSLIVAEAQAAFTDDSALAAEAKSYYDKLVADDLQPQRDVIGNVHRTFLAEVL